jgi:DNA-binding transcriptional MerR regulator
MRIGEITALVGVTSRAVRRYHHIGPLPEPPRQASGYRAYGLRDAVLPARIRRLTEIELSLDEVRDVLADDAGRVLTEELDGAAADDPRIAAPADGSAGAVPDEVPAAIPAGVPVATGFGQAPLADHPPAQAGVVRRMTRNPAARTNRRPS